MVSSCLRIFKLFWFRLVLGLGKFCIWVIHVRGPGFLGWAITGLNEFRLLSFQDCVVSGLSHFGFESFTDPGWTGLGWLLWLNWVRFG